jgi:hypothetical protein
MDTRSLVESQTHDGRSLVTKLRDDGIKLRAAFWAKPAEEERWLLYLATPALVEKGILLAYRMVLQSLRSLGEVSFEGSNVLKLISDREPLTEAISDFSKRFPDAAQTFLTRSVFADLSFDGVYIYSLGETNITLHGMYFEGEPSGSLHLSFERHNGKSKIIEEDSSGVCREYNARTDIDWVIAAPEGAKLERDEYQMMVLSVDIRGRRRQLKPNTAMAYADLGLHGFRIVREPTNLTPSDLLTSRTNSKKVSS